MQIEATRISIPYYPYQFEQGNHTIEKDEVINGQPIKRKYVSGITSGIKTDLHGEKMTPNCIKSFMEQSNSGDILLYADVHGIKASEDIGILTKAEVLSDGDWFAEYRLYDALDGIGANKIEKINNVWKQINGLPPYKRARQRGFSIEGLIPENGILQANKDEYGNLTNRVIDQIDLDGVIICPKPAYGSSAANAAYKALGEMPPHKAEKLRKSVAGELREKVNEEKLRDVYYSARWDVNDALERQIEKIMKQNDSDKMDQLNLVFDEYKNMMIDLIMQSESLFIRDDDEDANIDSPVIGVSKSSKRLEVYKALYTQVRELKKSITRRKTNGSKSKS